MNRFIKAQCGVMLAAAIAMLATGFSQDIPWGKETKAPELPLIFKGRTAERLAAEEVGRQDAYRKLIERVYGLALDGQTDVHDFALQSHQFDAALQNELKGMKELGKKYYDDGRVEVAVKITLREVVEIIKSSVKRSMKGEKLVSEEVIENLERENRDKDVIAVGRGGLPKTKGLERARGMRAAEIDCYRQIASRIFGITINATTTVRDFMLSSDSIKSKLSVALLNGVRFTDYTYEEDVCKATGEVTYREVVEVLTRTVRRYGKGSRVKVEEIENVERKNRDKIIEAVGVGTYRLAATTAETAPAAKPSFEPFYERKTVIERVISKGIAVD